MRAATLELPELARFIGRRVEVVVREEEAQASGCRPDGAPQRRTRAAPRAIRPPTLRSLGTRRPPTRPPVDSRHGPGGSAAHLGRHRLRLEAEREGGEIEIPAVSLSKLGDWRRGSYTSVADVVRHEYGHAVADTQRSLTRSSRFRDAFGASFEICDSFEYDHGFARRSPAAAPGGAADSEEVAWRFVQELGWAVRRASGAGDDQRPSIGATSAQLTSDRHEPCTCTSRIRTARGRR